jgi:SHS2 domain-containing protein
MTQDSIAGWRHFHHEADIGIEGWGPSQAEAFRQAAMAMTAVVTEIQLVRCDTSIGIECRAGEPDYLLLDWLNSLVFEMATRHMLFSEFDITIKGDLLQARACGEAVDRERHQPAVEIKGATMTGLMVYQDERQFWHACCVVDV